MRITSFKDLYIAELQELADMERQLATALRRMADIALHAGLKRALADHFQQTTGQRERLRSLIQTHGASPTAHTDQAMQALIRETEKMFAILKDADLRDAALIASAQKLEHYEIAAYGTAATLAGQLDLRNDQAMLHENLEEEKGMDLLLTQLAKSEINRDALAA
jgi:ferritin-like metal-binding protein YciE